MDAEHKKILKALSLELRHLLEGWYDNAGRWHAGDLEQRLNALGVWRDRKPVPADELAHLSPADREARQVADAYLKLREEAGVELDEAVAEFVRETAYTWANRLLALRCMEARGLIDEVILQKPVYGGRSLAHHRLAQRQPELCLGEDGGLFAMLDRAFERQAEHLPLLFDPRAPGVAPQPSVPAIKRAIVLLSGTEAVKGQDPAVDEVFRAPDALGWAYQYWNTEEKDRVFETVRTQRGAKIEGADIIPATQLYTEPYMVKFLVQNSLGALWMGMYPESRLCDKWAYYVRDADRAPVERKPVREITFLDPAVGSGHFLLEAFDLFYDMYLEEGEVTELEAICASILENNLFGIDIDERAVQIAEAALWMKAAERAFGFKGVPVNLVATNVRLPRGKDHLEAFLRQYPEDHDLRPALEVIFESLEHADELGSLLQIEEPVEKELRYLKARYEERKGKPEQLVLLDEVRKPRQGELPLGVESFEDWQAQTLTRLREHFADEALVADLAQAFFSRSVGKGLGLFDLLSRKYDVSAANPPYMGAGSLSVYFKDYVAEHYTEGKWDLYTCFILRCLSLTSHRGLTAMVTMQSWAFLSRFAKFRSLLSEMAFLEVFSHFGSYAFDAETALHVGVATAAFVLRKGLPDDYFQATFLRLTDVDFPSAKSSMLQATVSDESSPRVFKRRMTDFSLLPDNVLAYWIGDGTLASFSNPKVSSLGDVTWGFSTSANKRFLRTFWETPRTPSRWLLHLKGGGFARWRGFEQWCIDWEEDGSRLTKFLDERYPYLKGNVGIKLRPHTVGRGGWAYTKFANGSPSFRWFTSEWTTNAASPAVFEPEWGIGTGILLNSRMFTWLFRLVCQKMDVEAGYVASVPLPDGQIDEADELAQVCVGLKAKSLAYEVTEYLADPSLQREYWGMQVVVAMDAIRHAVEGLAEHAVFRAYNLSDQEVSSIVSSLGHPVGWLPLLDGYDTPPELPDRPLNAVSYLHKALGRCSRLSLPPDELHVVKSQARVLFEAGPGARIEVELDGKADTSDDEDDAQVGIPIPAETFLEELSSKLKLHPVSIFWILKEGIEKEGWRCLPEERRITSDRFTVIVLRLLGHRWPKQIEACEPVPNWADVDGIIPLTKATDEPTLLDRVRQRIAAEFPGSDVTAIEREFAEIMGKPMDLWLTTEFFKHHVSQFKKRPVAWQIQSGRFTTRQQPAFACLVYYHKLNGATLATIQSQYVRPLRQRYATELRGLEGIAREARSAQQDARRAELQEAIQELTEFDATLEQVAREGFASTAMEKIVLKEPLDRWCSIDGAKPAPESREALLRQEQGYTPDLNDGVRVNIAPLQKAGLLAANVLSAKDVDQAIADRAEWRADERRWCREGKLPKPGWWVESDNR